MSTDKTIVLVTYSTVGVRCLPTHLEGGSILIKRTANGGIGFELAAQLLDDVSEHVYPATVS